MASTAPNAILDTLRAGTVASFVAEDAVLEFEAGVQCTEALRVMNSVGVTGAPIFTKLADDSTAYIATGSHHHDVVGHNKRYIGFVDVVDLTCMLLTSGLRRSTPKGILKRLGAAFLPDEDHKVGFAVNYSGQDRFLHVPSNATLAQAANLMVSRHARRVAIVRPTHSGRQELVGIIAPSDVLYVIQGSMGELGSLASIEIGKLFPVDPSRMIKVDETTTLDVAFDVMLEAGVSSVPVVDAAGSMVTILSFSDVKEFGYLKADESKFVLSQNVLWFLSPRKGGEVTGLPMPPITVTANDAVSTVIEVMIASKVHQVYIVDGDRRPVGVVSMIELLGLLISPHVILHATSPAEPSSPLTADGVELVSYVPSSEFVAKLHAISAGEFATREAELAGVSEDLTTIAVSTSMPLRDVVSFVRDYSLRMVPVYEPEVATVADGRKYVGWVSPLDIVAARKSVGLKDTSLPFWRSRKDDVEHLARAVMNFSNTDPYYAVRDGMTLSQVFAIVGGRNLENVAVLDKSPEQWPIGIITPKYLIRFLNEVRSTLGSLSLLPVAELMSGTVAARPKVTVEATVGEAIDAMIAARVTTVPVVDVLTGKLVATLGPAELHAIATLPTDDDFNDTMALLVADYLEDFRALVELDTSSSAQTVRPTDTLNTVLELMTASGASAVHVINDERQPIGLVTSFDVIRAVRPPTGGL